MVNIILHGCNGAMGKVITDLAAQEADLRIAAGIDLNAAQQADYPVYASCEACDVNADVIVDFSVAPAVDAVIAYARKRKLPLVLCTTGLSEAQLQAVDAAAKEIPVLRSANMSLGVNTLFKLAALTAQILADKGYDIEIMEKHHHRKLDAPSGTALAIADAINEAMDGKGELTVKNGKMTVHIILASKKITKLYFGLADDAKKEGAKLIEPTVDIVTYSDGMKDEAYGFDVPVPKLDEEFDVAILGSKDNWYDHKIKVSNPVPKK
jgi:4-hydroxy-tetrahydrodipicolinate reductase